MALPELLAALERDAAARAAAILDAARAAAAERVDAARAAAARRRAEQLDRREAAEREKMAQALGAARREARRRALDARDAFLERVQRAAEGRLAAALHDPAYAASLADRLDAALAFTGNEPVEVRAAPVLAPALRRLARERPQEIAVTEDPATDTGFVVRTGDGRVTVDRTLAADLAQDWPSLAMQLVARRGGDGR